MSPVLDALRAAADRHGAKPAVLDSTGAGYDYPGFARAVEDGARWIRARRARPPLLLVPGGGPDDVVAVFAAIVAGAVPLIADRTWTPAECARIAATTGATAVLAGTDTAAEPAAPQDTPWPDLRWSDDPWPGADRPTRTNDELAGIAFGRFTSGTTGLPRCLGFTADAALNAGRAWRLGAGLTSDDVVLCLATLNNGLAFNTSLLSVFGAGATLVLHAGRPIPSSVARSVRRVAPTVLVAFPFAFDAIVRAGSDLGRGLRLAVSSAAPLSAATARAWRELAGVGICDYYGLAEVGPVTFNDGTVPGSVGVPLPGVSIVTEPDGRVLVRTAAMAARYLDGRLPALADSLTDEGYLRARDLGAITADGRLSLVGRLGEVVNVAGRKIDPTEVAEVIRRLDGVVEVVVRGEQATDGELLAAYVESTTVDRDSVVAHCRRNLSIYKLPQRIAVLPRLPRTSTGKVNAAALAGMGSST